MDQSHPIPDWAQAVTWKLTAETIQRYVEKLEDAIRFMCTEMPVGWEEMAVAEGRKTVVDVVQWAVNREGDYPATLEAALQQFDGSIAPSGDSSQ